RRHRRSRNSRSRSRRGCSRRSLPARRRRGRDLNACRIGEIISLLLAAAKQEGEQAATTALVLGRVVGNHDRNVATTALQFGERLLVAGHRLAVSRDVNGL